MFSNIAFSAGLLSEKKEVAVEGGVEVGTTVATHSNSVAEPNNFRVKLTSQQLKQTTLTSNLRYSGSTGYHLENRNNYNGSVPINWGQ